MDLKSNKIYVLMDASEIGAVFYSELTKPQIENMEFEASQVVDHVDSCEDYSTVFKQKMRKADKKFKWLKPKEIKSHQTWWY